MRIQPEDFNADRLFDDLKAATLFWRFSPGGIEGHLRGLIASGATLVRWDGVAMVAIQFDLPIFSSPTEPHGWFSGVLDLQAMPEDGSPFPWPEEWLHQFAELFEEQRLQVWGLSEWPSPLATLHVAMFGLVCRDRNQAGELARHVERCSGLVFNEHEMTDAST